MSTNQKKLKTVNQMESQTKVYSHWTLWQKTGRISQHKNLREQKEQELFVTMWEYQALRSSKECSELTGCKIAKSLKKDIDTATEIWGPDVACLKGKTMQKGPKEFVDKVVQTPPELTVRMSEVIIHMDNPHMNRMTFLSCIVKPVLHGNTMPLTDATADMLHKALDKITRKLNGAGCTTKMIRCDKKLSH